MVITIDPALCERLWASVLKIWVKKRLGLTLAQVRLFSIHGCEISTSSLANILTMSVKRRTSPTEDGKFNLVVTQECLEHVADPFKAVEEIHRVLKKDGKLFIQLPFIIGYHPGPTDFWRFTKEGIRELVERAGFKVQEIGITVGPSSGFYRIAVEYFAVLFSLPLSKLYVPFKALLAVLFYPMKWLDPLLNRSSPSGSCSRGLLYYCCENLRFARSSIERSAGQSFVRKSIRPAVEFTTRISVSQNCVAIREWLPCL